MPGPIKAAPRLNSLCQKDSLTVSQVAERAGIGDGNGLEMEEFKRDVEPAKVLDKSRNEVCFPEKEVTHYERGKLSAA
jgi:hypothetical protein